MSESGTNKAEETQTTVNTKLIMMIVVVSCSKMRTKASKVATLDLFYQKNIVTKKLNNQVSSHHRSLSLLSQPHPTIVPL